MQTVLSSVFQGQCMNSLLDHDGELVCAKEREGNCQSTVTAIQITIVLHYSKLCMGSKSVCMLLCVCVCVCACAHVCVCVWLLIAYKVLFSALLSRLTVLACGATWVISFLWWVLISTKVVSVLTALAWLVPQETAAVSAHVLCTPYNHAPCHFMQSHIHKVYECLAVTCHLHFWQNDRDLLGATEVVWGWNGYRNKTKSQHRKSTMEKKILPPLLQGFEPMTFQLWHIERVLL